MELITQHVWGIFVIMEPLNGIILGTKRYHDPRLARSGEGVWNSEGSARYRQSSIAAGYMTLILGE